jgi:hypothetical protein
MIPAMFGDQFGWNDSKGIARAILRDRGSRRRLIARLLLIALIMMGAGLWLLEDILSTHVWWFLIWWGSCAVTTLLVMMFALYDGLAVMREEREKHR